MLWEKIKFERDENSSLIVFIFVCLSFSLVPLMTSWTSSICLKTQWAPQRGVLATTLPPPPPPPRCSTIPRLPSQVWAAAMATCRIRCPWGPTCCTPTAAEDSPTSSSRVSSTDWFVDLLSITGHRRCTLGFGMCFVCFVISKNVRRCRTQHTTRKLSEVWRITG